jgi:oxygen-independent coproporphyrinogen-3 oxidase
MLNHTIPLCLYIHIPWCVRKCPYCDFNSHALRTDLPEKSYIHRLIQELEAKLFLVENREIKNIFIGGGTPSLFSGEAYKLLFQELGHRIHINPHAEITMEANPGTVDQAHFKDYFMAGINRLSLGVQSLQNEKLAALGRIHNREQVLQAIDVAKQAGFSNFNIDLMFGLPKQNIDDALKDLYDAIQLQPTHLSWYQLTLEPNTVFYKYPPKLPKDELIWQMQLTGQAFLASQGYSQYEISAYSQSGFQCQHNLNYWRFGDYLGLGAGAHSKITDMQGEITRHSNIKNPRSYLNAENCIIEQRTLTREEIPLEFMLNAARLQQPIPFKLFEATTQLKLDCMQDILNQAKQLEFLQITDNEIQITARGHQYLNELLELFL